MKKNINKKVLIAVIILILIILCFALGGGNNTENTNTTAENTDISNTNIENETTEDLVEYYKDDAMINLFINKYNQLYDDKITTEMLTAYDNNGKIHTNQVELYIDGLEVLLTGNTTNISVYIENTSDSNSDEALRNLTKKIVKVYNQDVTDGQIEEYLSNQDSSSDIQTHDGLEYWINREVDNNMINYIKLTGNLE